MLFWERTRCKTDRQTWLVHIKKKKKSKWDVQCTIHVTRRRKKWVRENNYSGRKVQRGKKRGEKKRGKKRERIKREEREQI